jgi:alpha-amylase
MNLAIPSWRLWVQALFIPVMLGLVTMDSPAQSSNRFWQAQSIYQIITDRFYDGNTNNDNVEGTYAPSNPTGVHGGDFAGLEQKLDYIKALGATAIWISPIVLNTEGQYHGYSAWNYYEVAPHWGSITDLQNVVQAAHARGLKVIDDIVLNHAGDLVTGSGSGWPNYSYPKGYTLSYVNTNKTYPTPFNLTTANPHLTNLWHNYGDIDSFSSTQEVVLGWLDGLNDLKTETTYVRTNMISIYKYWINQIGFDAFRVDTVLEVDQGCWQTFCPAIYSYTATNVPYGATNANTNFFMFGEVDNGSESTVGPYTGTEAGGPYEFESTEDYPLYYDLNNVFATLSGDTEQIQNHYNDLQTYYDPTTWAQQVIFLDNQDNPRFLSTSESNDNTNALKAALAFLYTSIGIPCLYYGTEQGFYGTTDPDCREDMFAGEWKDGPDGTVVSLSSPGVDNFNMTHPLFQWVSQLNNFRRLYPAMSLGSYVNQWYNSSGPGLFAYSRILNTQEVFVVFNTASSSQTLPARTLTYPTGTVLVNLLNTNETYTLAAGSQTPAITVPSTTAKIFIAQSQWQPLDPVVANNSPSHWATNVPNYSPIVLQFSESMDTNSVQAAFSTIPSVSGSFSWSSVIEPNDTMTFTPNSAGFPPSTNITVTVTNSAFDAVSSNNMFAPYDLSFQTAVAVGPVLAIASPANNTDFIPGSSIAITVNASEYGSGTLTNVAFYANTTLIGNAPSAPYSLTWPGAPAGSYALTAVVSDSLGNSATSSVVNITVGPMVSITAPVNNTNFNPGSSIVITATASETGGTLTNVAFYANATLLANATSAPYNFTWTNVSTGDYALTAVATDAGGYSTTSSVVNVTVTRSAAYDVESNYSTWTNGQNEGYGFEPWVLVGIGEYNGFILTPSGTIDTSGDSWALYANGTGTPYAYAYRSFSNSLTAGEVFSVQFADTAVTSPGSMGFCLRNSNNTNLIGSTTPPPPIVTNSATRFAFYFIGGQGDYTIWDGKGTNNSGIAFTTNGLTLQFYLLTADTYKLIVKSANGSTILTNWSGTLAGTLGSAIQMFTAFNVDTATLQDDYFNTLQISAAGPVVTIASPTNNTGFASGGNIAISANAADLSGLTLTNVAFYANATLISNATGTPYSLTWTNVSTGDYALTAVASDSLGISATSSVVNVTVGSPTTYFSSPATDGLVIPLASNITYLIQVCYTSTLDTNNTSLFELTINGVLQPQSSYILGAQGSVSGCSGMSSLLYDWTTNSSGTTTGSNVIQVVYSNGSSGLVLSNSVTVIVPPPLVISASVLASDNQTVVWSSTPGTNYMVLATTNLSQPFTPISGVISATGLSTSYVDISNSPPVPQKFYEIEVVP